MLPKWVLKGLKTELPMIFSSACANSYMHVKTYIINQGKHL